LTLTGSLKIYVTSPYNIVHLDMSWLTRRRGVGGRSGVVAESEAEVQESACDTVVLGLVTVIQRYRTELNQSVERDLADVSTGRQLLLVTPTQTHTSFKPW